MITKQQRKAIYKLWLRDGQKIPYKAFRKQVKNGYDCLMINIWGMWLGIEKDGYTHS
jgi:hypothetical protein